MNRPIKFRAWDKREKIMLYDVGIAGVGEAFLGGPTMRTDLGEDAIPMQFTGLKDKNGKEIYEGDIIRILYTDWGSQYLGTEEQKKMSFEDYKKSISNIGIVIFQEERFCLEFNGRFDKETNSIFEGTHGEKEVIGNIYENPELLKPKELTN